MNDKLFGTQTMNNKPLERKLFGVQKMKAPSGKIFKVKVRTVPDYKLQTITTGETI